MKKPAEAGRDLGLKGGAGWLLIKRQRRYRRSDGCVCSDAQLCIRIRQPGLNGSIDCCAGVGYCCICSVSGLINLSHESVLMHNLCRCLAPTTSGKFEIQITDFHAKPFLQSLLAQPNTLPEACLPASPSANQKPRHKLTRRCCIRYLIPYRRLHRHVAANSLY